MMPLRNTAEMKRSDAALDAVRDRMQVGQHATVEQLADGREVDAGRLALALRQAVRRGFMEMHIGRGPAFTATFKPLVAPAKIRLGVPRKSREKRVPVVVEKTAAIGCSFLPTAITTVFAGGVNPWTGKAVHA